MNQLEDGEDVAIEWKKIQSIATTGHDVIPVVLQHAETSEVLFVAFTNQEAFEATLNEGRVVLWSTSRNELWRKGATSGDVLELVEARVNCEQNSLLYRVRPAQGGVCHTRDETGQTRSACYYRRIINAEKLAFRD